MGWFWEAIGPLFIVAIALVLIVIGPFLLTVLFAGAFAYYLVIDEDGDRKRFTANPLRWLVAIGAFVVGFLVIAWLNGATPNVGPWGLK